jgi:iron complex transport system substrate-binding protein
MSRFVNLTCRLFVLAALLSVFAPIAGALEDAPFTIQADDDLKPALELLYGAVYDGVAPTFVEDGADLLATADSETLAIDAYLDRPIYFLYGAGLAPLTENEDALAFMDFTVTAEAQQLLIDAGLLPGTVTVVDQGGNEVEAPQPVQNILSPYSMGTYYIYSVGAADRVIAANFLGWRGKAGENMALIDPGFMDKINVMEMSQEELNVEEAAALMPDLITASTRTAWIDAVRELGVPLVLYEGETPEALKEAMLLTGQYLGPNALARAEAWVDYYDWVYEVVTEKTGALAEAGRVKVLFSGTEPLRVTSGDMYQTAMIEAAGGISVSADLVGYWNDVNLEQVITWNPDVIFVPSYGGASVEAITESEEWQALEAVREGRVYQLPLFSAPLDTPVPDSVLGIVWMAQVLYPDLLGDDLDCATEAGYFYSTWYDYDLPDDVAASLCGE